jgi:uncharacterized protein (DUF4415 family)
MATEPTTRAPDLFRGAPKTSRPTRLTAPKTPATPAKAATPATAAPAASKAAATAAKPKAKKAIRVDPNKCSVARCRNASALTHLGKPLCKKHWEKQCEAEEGKPSASKPAPNQRETTDKADAKATPAKKKAAKPKADAGKPKKLSAINAAAQVLEKAKKPMKAQELIAEMSKQGLWTSPGGATPHATLYSAILREIGTKGDHARFERSKEKGAFTFRKPKGGAK